MKISVRDSFRVIENTIAPIPKYDDITLRAWERGSKEMGKDVDWTEFRKAFLALKDAPYPSDDSW